MRETLLEASHIRKIYDVVKSSSLTLITSALTIGNYVHTNPIVLSNIFLDKCEGFIEPLRLIIWEKASTLLKLAMKVYILDECDMEFTAGTAFKWADGTDTDLFNIIDIIDVQATDYTEVKDNGSATGAIAFVNIDNSVLKAISGQRYLKIICVANGAGAYASGADVKLGLGIVAG